MKRFSDKTMKKIQLFCIPYAGGSANFFLKFNRFINENIEIVPIELSGHSSRMFEDCLDIMDEVVKDLAAQIEEKSDGSPYGLLGYSMGSTICYELGYELAKKMGQPVHIFYVAQNPPYSFSEEEKEEKEVTDDMLLAYIRRYHVLPDELLEDEEIYEMIMSVLKADFKLMLSYQGKRKADKMKCDITVIHSEEEKGNMIAWADSTEGTYKEYIFEGGHFFINQHLEEVVEHINNTLRMYMK